MPPLGNPWTALDNHRDVAETQMLHFRLNGVFTLPEARRRGISKALIVKGIEHTQDHIGSPGGTHAIFSVVVDEDNIATKALYESAGLIETKRLIADEGGVGRGVVVLIYEQSRSFGPI
jgi:GNAT superfamily N-acetyltransferase